MKKAICVTPKRQVTFTGLHSIIFKKIGPSIAKAGSHSHNTIFAIQRRKSLSAAPDSFMNNTLIKSPIFWDITQCSPLKVDRRFGGKCRPHLQGIRMSHPRNQHEEGSKQNQIRPTFLGTCFILLFLGLFLKLEDGGDMFPRNVG
jgi:hypothetical protein